MPTPLATPTPVLADPRLGTGIVGVAPHPQISVGGPMIGGGSFPSSFPQPIAEFMPAGVMPAGGMPLSHAPGCVVYSMSHDNDVMASEHRHYRFSVDLRTLHNLTLEPGIKCYLR